MAGSFPAFIHLTDHTTIEICHETGKSKTYFQTKRTLKKLPPFCLFCPTAETLQAQCSRQDGRAWKSRGCMFDWYLAPFLYMNHLKIHNSYITVYLKICFFNYFRKRCRFRRALDVVLPIHNTNFP